MTETIIAAIVTAFVGAADLPPHKTAEQIVCSPTTVSAKGDVAFVHHRNVIIDLPDYNLGGGYGTRWLAGGTEVHYLKDKEHQRVYITSDVPLMGETTLLLMDCEEK